MHSGLSALAATAISLALTFSSAVFAADSGAIEKVSGNVTITGADKVSRKAAANDRIQSGDTITTDAKSEAMIKLADNSAIALRQNTQFQVTEFKYDKKPSDSSFFSLAKGVARMVSGLIGTASPQRVKITTPTATIGIRGTDYEVAVIPEDTPEARAGVYDHVHKGQTYVQIASGQSVEVKKEQTAFAPDKPRPGEEPLYILAEKPLFLQQGGGFDALIQSLTMQPINVIQHMPMIR